MNMGAVLVFRVRIHMSEGRTGRSPFLSWSFPFFIRWAIFAATHLASIRSMLRLSPFSSSSLLSISGSSIISVGPKSSSQEAPSIRLSSSP